MTYTQALISDYRWYLKQLRGGAYLEHPEFSIASVWDTPTVEVAGLFSLAAKLKYSCTTEQAINFFERLLEYWEQQS